MIHVAMATDDRYWPYVTTLLGSIVAHTARPVTAHLLVRAISGVRQWAAACSTGPLTINAIETDGYLDSVRLYLGSHITRSTMDRLMLPDLLPGVDRVIYIDVDALVLADVAPLYDMDAGPTGLLARPSEHRGFRTVGRCLHTWRHDNIAQILPHIDPDWPSFNAGVMLMDLDRLRQNGFVEQTARCVNEFGVSDQVACAIYARGQFARLDPTWNVFAGTDHRRVAPWRILHWAGQSKPWMPKTALHAQWKWYRERRIRPRTPGAVATRPISLVTSCMNRHDHLRQSLPTWLNKGFDDIIVLDWSSTPPLDAIVDEFQDGTITLVQLVEPREHFHQAKSKNLKMRLARHDLTCTMDCDVQILADDFIDQHPMAPGVFYAQGGEHLGGSGFYWKADWQRFGGCNEAMVGWGHEDSDLHHRMHDAGWRWKKLMTDTVRHIPHGDAERVRNFAPEYCDRTKTLKANSRLVHGFDSARQQPILVRARRPNHESCVLMV